MLIKLRVSCAFGHCLCWRARDGFEYVAKECRTISSSLKHRTGKRTVFGAMKDGWNSMIRYYKNNFADGFRQVQCILFCP